MLSQRTYISQFDIQPDGVINVRKSTDILMDDVVIANGKPWRCVLVPNDPQAQSVLGDEPYYLNLAQQAWAALPQE